MYTTNETIGIVSRKGWGLEGGRDKVDFMGLVCKYSPSGQKYLAFIQKWLSISISLIWPLYSSYPQV